MHSSQLLQLCMFSWRHLLKHVHSHVTNSSVLPELLMFSLPIAYLQWFHHISWVCTLKLKRMASIRCAEWFNVAHSSCGSPGYPVALLFVKDCSVCLGFTHSSLRSPVGSAALPLLPRAGETKYNPRWSAEVNVCFLCILCSRVPKHLIPLVSLFLYTISSFPPLSLCACFFGLLVSPGPRCIPPLILALSLLPKINNLCTEACQLFVQKEFGCHSDLGLRGEGSLQI